MNKISLFLGGAIAAAVIGTGEARASDPICYMDMGDGMVDLSYLCGHGGGGPVGMSQPTRLPTQSGQGQQPVRRYGAFLTRYESSNPNGTYREARIISDARDYCRGTEDLAGNSFATDALSWTFDQIDEARNAQEREVLTDHWFAIHWNAAATFC